MKFLVLYYDGNHAKACVVENDGPFEIEAVMPSDCESINAVVEVDDNAELYVDNDWEYPIITTFPNGERSTKL